MRKGYFAAIIVIMASVSIFTALPAHTSAEDGYARSIKLNNSMEINIESAQEAIKNLKDTQWGLTAIRAEDAWVYSKGEGVTVAVIDSGIDGTHPDLEGRVLRGWSEYIKAPILEKRNSDVFGHGTHIAGIIAGNNDGIGITGVAPEAKILPVAVTDRDLRSRGNIVADGILWAVANGADVINLSLAGVRSVDDDGGPWCPAISAAFEAGVIVVTSAGNSGTRGNPAMNPASCPHVVSVTSIDETLVHTPYASWDSTVSFAAPGRQIVSTLPTDRYNYPYAQWSGTSMAAPFVTGSIALLISAYPDWSPTKIIETLARTANDIGATGRDATSGYGIIDPAAALGAPRITVEKLAKQVGDVSRPTMLEVRRLGKSTIVHWERPLAASATSYRIVNLNKKIRNFETKEGVFELKIPELIVGGTWFVVADVANEKRWSFPLTLLDLYMPDAGRAIDLLPHSVKASWGETGLTVDLVATGRKGPVLLSVTGQGFELSATMLGGVESYTIAVPANSIGRSIPLRISASTPTGVVLNEIQPQYQISASILGAGSRAVAIIGSTITACLELDLGCPGDLVSINRLNGTLVGSALVNDKYRFVSLLAWDGISNIDYFVSSGAAISPIVNKENSKGYSKGLGLIRTERIIDLKREY